MTIIGVAITRPMLILLRTPDSILDWCAKYLIILFLGSIGLDFYNILSGVLRGMGVSGVALATICSITLGIRLFNLSPYFISI